MKTTIDRIDKILTRDFPPTTEGWIHKRDTASYTLSFEAPSVCQLATVRNKSYESHLS